MTNITCRAALFALAMVGWSRAVDDRRKDRRLVLLDADPGRSAAPPDVEDNESR